MEDWRTSDKGEGPSVKSEKLLIATARQKIWLHWLLWCFPIINFAGSVISAVLIREWKPVASVFGFGFIWGLIGGMESEGSVIVLYFTNIAAAGWTHYIIQTTREKIDEIRSK